MRAIGRPTRLPPLCYATPTPLAHHVARLARRVFPTRRCVPPAPAFMPPSRALAIHGQDLPPSPSRERPPACTPHCRIAALPHCRIAAQIPPSAQEIDIGAEKAARMAIRTAAVKNTRSSRNSSHVAKIGHHWPHHIPHAVNIRQFLAPSGIHAAAPVPCPFRGRNRNIVAMPCPFTGQESECYR